MLKMESFLQAKGKRRFTGIQYRRYKEDNFAAKM
jgi:hypothetical protein